MKRTLRGFGIGVFLIGAIWTIYEQYLAPTESEQIITFEQQLAQSKAEIASLEKKLAGSTTTETEAATNEIAVSDKTTGDATTKQNEEKSVQKTEAKEDTPKETDEAEVTTGTIYIYENVSFYDIGKQAEDQGIIENGRELELYLYKPEYARSIQKGQFELNSDMALEDMALILSGKQTQ